MPDASPLIRAAVAVGLSVVAHAVLVGAALALSVNAGWGDQAPPDPIAIEILSTNEPRPVEVPERHATPDARTVEQAPREPRNVRPTNREVTSTEQPMVEAPTIMAPEVQVERPANTQTPQERDRMAMLINPASVARAGWTVEGAGPTMPGPPAGLGRDRGRSEREIEQELGTSLRAEAMTKTHTSREHLRIQRRADGTYVHEGHRFSAVIRQDGSVVFNDRPGVSYDVATGGGGFDLGDLAMQGSGQDPNRAERERFMQETEELRERLETESRRSDMTRGLRELRGRLVRVWATESRTTAARRRRIFGIWDEIEDGEAGREARGIVVQFIRETIPQGHADAFTSAELTRFNASRVSRDEFHPY